MEFCGKLHIFAKNRTKLFSYVLNYIQIYKILQISVILRECVQFCTKFQSRLLFYSGLQKIFSIGKSNSSGGAKCKASHNDSKVLVKLLYILPCPNIALWVSDDLRYWAAIATKRDLLIYYKMYFLFWMNGSSTITT